MNNKTTTIKNIILKVWRLLFCHGGAPQSITYRGNHPDILGERALPLYNKEAKNTRTGGNNVRVKD